MMRKLDFGSLLTVLVAAVINRSILLMMNPLGIACFTGAYMTVSGRGFLFIASLAGMATVMPIKVLLKYAGIMLGIVVIEKILRTSRRKVALWQAALCCGILVFAAGTAYSVGLSGLESRLMLRSAVVSLLEGMAVFCLTFIFNKAINVICAKEPKAWLTNEEQLSTGILFAAALYAISGPTTEKYSLIQALVFLLLFYTGYRYGCGTSAVLGACTGTVMAINANDAAMLGYMCLAGVVAGAFREKGRIFSVCANIAALGFMGYMGASYMAEMTTVRGVLAAAAVFLLLPVNAASVRENGVFPIEKRQLPRNQNRSRPDVSLEMTKQRLQDFALAFKKLSQTFQISVVPRLDLSGDEAENAFDEVTQNVCAGCSRCELCWEREYNDSFWAAHNILDFYSKNGSITRSQVPIGFRQRCVNVDGFINETGRVIEMAKLNLDWKNRFMECRLAVAGQFMEVADIINDFSTSLDNHTSETEEVLAAQLKARLSGKKMKVRDVSVIEKGGRGRHVYISAKMRQGRFVTAKEICQVLEDVFHKAFVLGKGCRMVVSREYRTYEFVEDTRYRVIEGTAMCPVSGRPVSGDTCTTMHLDNGQVILSLSDGMGTGAKASEESSYMIRLMEQLMDTGFGKRAAVRLLNSLMFLKSDSGSFSTVDMGIIDLYTGKCEFVKMGAAGSAIIHRDTKEIEWIESSSLPAGAFTEVDYEEVMSQLSDGDKIVMVSDGIMNSEAFNERDVGSAAMRFQKYLNRIRDESPQDMADKILNYAKSPSGTHDDDMTVLVCGIYNNI